MHYYDTFATNVDAVTQLLPQNCRIYGILDVICVKCEHFLQLAVVSYAFFVRCQIFVLFVSIL